jgi:protein TonB
MKSDTDRKRSLLYALAGSIFGTLLVVASVVFMNKQAVTPNREAVLVGSTIKVERKEKPPEQRTVQQPKPKPKPRRTAAAPAVGIDSGLAGLNFGLPQFDSDDLGALAGNLLGGDGDTVMTDDTVDNPPRPVVQSPMAYPPRAKAQGVTGYVVLSVLIGPTGAVEKVKVLESQPSGVFDDTAIAGVQTWKFEPAQYKGENVRVWATQRVSFNLG